MDGTVAGVSVFVDLTVAHALETSGPIPVRLGIRRSRQTYQNSVSGDLISFLLQGKKKAEDILIHVPGLCLLAFFCCQI